VRLGVVEARLQHINSRFAASVDGAAAVLARLSLPEVEVRNGAFYDGLFPAPPAPLVDNPHATDRLWRLSTLFVGQERLTVGKAV
jgi:hypothetical protein